MKKNWFSILLFIIALGILAAAWIIFYIDEEIFFMLCSWFGMSACVLVLIILGLANWDSDGDEKDE
jgi:hypothetical protein